MPAAKARDRGDGPRRAAGRGRREAWPGPLAAAWTPGWGVRLRRTSPVRWIGSSGATASRPAPAWGTFIPRHVQLGMNNETPKADGGQRAAL